MSDNIDPTATLFCKAVIGVARRRDSLQTRIRSIELQTSSLFQATSNKVMTRVFPDCLFEVEFILSRKVTRTPKFAVMFNSKDKHNTADE